jgi:O-antigen/teichoic acid export membrane protein
MARFLPGRVVSLFSGDDMRARALRGAVWTFMGFGLANVLRLGSNLILTRILAPDVFGLMALATVFVTALTVMTDMGTTASVVRGERGEERPFLRTAWTIQILRGVIIGAVACLVAWPLAQLYDEPLLFPLMCVLALTPIIKGFQSMAFALHSRKMDVPRLTVMTTTAQAATVCVTVTAAFILESVWALAIGSIAGSLITVGMSFLILMRVDHGFQLEPEARREIIRFGRWILVGTFFTYMSGQGMQALQGTLVPIDILGLIAIAMLLGSLPGQFMFKIHESIAFPIFSRVRREDPDRLASVLLKFRLLLLAVVFPLFFGLAFFAQPIIDLMYDPRYAAAGFVLALILAEEAIATLSAPYQNLMLADGDSRFHALVMGLRAVSRGAGLFIGFSIAGIPGMLAGMAVGSTMMFLLSAGIAWRRGYASKSLDIASLGAGIAFYIYIFLSLELPTEFVGLGG